MKKILISVLIVLLLITTCFAIFKGISFAKIKSVKDIKNESNNLDKSIEQAKKVANQEYPAKVQTLEDSIKNLKLAKQEYENKNIYNAEQVNIGALEVKTYKIHYLWTILGNYRKDDGVRSLNLDLKATANKDVYDLQFTLVGNYVSITDFLYDIEDDEELKFQVNNFNLTKTEEEVAVTNQTAAEKKEPAQTNTNTFLNAKTNNTENNTTNNTVTNTKNTAKNSKDDPSEGGTILKATFTVKNIGITLD